MHLSPLIAMDLLGWSLPAWSQLLHFFRIACRCQQRHGPAGADGLGHRWREQRSSLCWLTEASLGAYLVVPSWGCSVTSRCQSPQGLTGAGTEVLRGLTYGQSFSVAECYCDTTGTSLRAVPCTALPAGNPFVCQDSGATRPPTLSSNLR